MISLTQHELNDEKRLSEIEHRIGDLSRKIDVLSRDVEDLVAAWKAANWLVNLVKWAAAVSSAVTVLYLLASGKGIK